ncbi:MAG: Holliday junction branch migration protein RuvA [Gammaproteobacteria bacterium]|nr:Holliday junction branch migration protein RuvA [Gammaproteobacteria bacterium]
MIGRLRGILLEKSAPNLLIDVGGIGYEVQLPVNSFYNLPQIGAEITLFTHFIVREDGHYLFGFISLSQRALFRTLLKVSGVGPKLGLAILSGMEPDVFVRHVLGNDPSSLERIPGVGKKLAQRLVVEMHDKLSDWETTGVVSDIKVSTAVRDAISALIALGYKSHEARKSLEAHQNKDLSSEELIRLALKDIR